MLIHIQPAHGYWSKDSIDNFCLSEKLINHQDYSYNGEERRISLIMNYPLSPSLLLISAFFFLLMVQNITIITVL